MEYPLSVAVRKITISLGEAELAKLDEIREGTRSAAIRELIRSATPDHAADAPTYTEAIRLLARSARDGKVQAQVALERALRAAREPVEDDELEKLLSGD
jgi:metal-responsive CopG/Arc/MetJ family transcriptional regulator